jgi:prophage regulatory protein
MSSIAKLKAVADEWAWQKEQSDKAADLLHHFDGVTPRELISMWECGERLTQFEVQALAEAWCRVFGEFPPDDDDLDPDCALPEPTAPESKLPADDTMLRAKDVVRLTGVSLATVKRMVLDGRFPKPMRLSPRRIGWPARDVKAWLDGLDGARRKVRS